MASTSKRALWKGAISFGLVHIPVALHSATVAQGVDFDWLDKRTMDRVGYKRINKATGKEISSENIVKGIEYEHGQYVVLSADEIAAAYPKTTQTVEIETFVDVDAVPFLYLERPYYMAPINKGSKVYALLREVLRRTGKVGIAKVVIQSKQHLAVLMPCGPALVLNLLRWSDEIRDWKDLDLPAAGTESTGLTQKELAMGEQLVVEMSGKWQPEAFTDSFREQIMELVKEKVAAGETAAVTEPEEHEEAPAGAKIYDLTELLQRSLRKDGDSGTDDSGKRPRTSGGRKTKGSSTADKDEDEADSRRSTSKTAKKTVSSRSGAKAAKSASAPRKTGKAGGTTARKSAKTSAHGRKAA